MPRTTTGATGFRAALLARPQVTGLRPARVGRVAAAWVRAAAGALLAATISALSGTAIASPRVSEVHAASVTPPHTPVIRAAAAYVMDRDTGEALFARYPAVRRPIASTTKLMTGLLAAESGRLDETFVVSQNAASVGETTMHAVAGERLTLRELAHGLMLPSGNDAAVAIAEALDGSVASFADHMNRRAHELGMWDSQFANPHGLDHERFYRPDHFSTARDMAVLGSAVGDTPEIRRIAGTTIFDVPSRDGRAPRTLRNTLAGLWWYPGMVAGKTGWTERAGQCRVVIADRGGIRLSVALLGTPDEFVELRDLLDYGFAAMEARRPITGVPMVPRSPDDFGRVAPDLSDAWERFWETFVRSLSEPCLSVAPTHATPCTHAAGTAMAWPTGQTTQEPINGSPAPSCLRRAPGGSLRTLPPRRTPSRPFSRSRRSLRAVWGLPTNRPRPRPANPSS